MGRFDFESPGAAFTGQITKMLTERKAEERQRLLDSLSFSADQRAQEALEREKRESDARMASQAQQDELQELTFAKDSMEPGDDPVSRGFSPKLIEAGKRRGIWTERPVPQVSTSISSMTDENGTPTEGDVPQQVESTPPQTRLGYVGSPEQRARERKLTSRGNMISQLLASKNPEEVKHGQLLATFAGLNPDGELPDQALDTFINDPVSIWNEATGKFTDTGQSVPHNTRVMPKGYAPRALQSRSLIQVGTDDAGQPVLVDQDKLKTDADGKVVIPGVHKTSAINTLGIPVGTQNNIMLAVGNLGSDPRSVDPEALNNFRTTVAGAIGNAKIANRAVLQIALAYVNDPEAALTAASQLLESNQLTAADVKDLTTLIDALVPAHVKEMLKMHPYRPSKEKEPWYSRIFDGQ